MTEIIPYFTVYASSAIRLGYGLNIGVIVLLTTAGMMSTVFSITFLDHIIQILIPHFLNLKKRKKFTPRTRKFIKIWKYSGIKGVAFITPILLSPVIGTVLLNAVGAKKKEIIKWMFVSAIIWSSIECILFYLFKDSFRMISSMIE